MHQSYRKYRLFMNRQILISAIFALALSILSEPAGAQDFKKAIRQHYVDAKTYVDDIQAVAAGGDIYPVPQCFTTHITQNLPGTGYHQEDISMYYREILSSDDQIYPSLALEFATKKYNFAAREFYEEYLYDDKQQIQFIFATTPDLAPNADHTCELRFYFLDGKIAEVLVKSRPLSGGAPTTIYSGKTVPEKYGAYYQARYDSSELIKRLFLALDTSREN